MLTFNLRSDINGNYFRGHEPVNSVSNCWSTHGDEALVFTLEQVRKIRAALGRGSIVIEPTDADPLTDVQFDKELWCVEPNGGSWYAYRKATDDHS